MWRTWSVFLCAWVGLGSGAAWAQAADGAKAVPAQAAAAVSTKKTCAVNSAAPNAAETALNRGDLAAGEKLFADMLAKDPHDEVAHGGLIRARLEQDKVDAAARDAEAWAAASPASSAAMVAVGDVRFRQGDPRAAFVQYLNAFRADACNARTYFGMARVHGLAGFQATRKRMIDQAYVLHPTDDEIHTAWVFTLPRKERLAKWAEYVEKSDQVSEENRAKMKVELAKASMYDPSDCRMAPGSPHEAATPMIALMDGPNRFVGWGLDVSFNGKRRQLQIDTGASGITISRAAALFLGITRQDVIATGGVGDKGPVKTSVAHVASIKIGGVEFTNCPVDILEKWSVLDSDGLIGGDVFDDSALTLDFPKHELRIAPLPIRPGEKPEAETLNSGGEDQDVERPLHDPYIAPEMAKWERVYRSGHQLLMPTGIVETKRFKDETAWKDKLFMLDTGAESNLISPAAAREVTKVSRDDSNSIRGISGEVDKVYEAGKFTMLFGGLRLDSPTMTSIDTKAISDSTGVEVSGFIGAPALFQVVMHIDYRDNLVWCEYKPRK